MIKFKNFFEELDPREELARQKAMVEKDPFSIMNISNPHPEVQEIAVRKNPNVVSFIKMKIYPRIIELAVERNGLQIRHFVGRASFRLFEVAVSQNVKAIQFLEYENYQTQFSLREFRERYDKLSEMAVRKDSNVIKVMRENPSKKVQALALENNPGLISFKHPFWDWDRDLVQKYSHTKAAHDVGIF